MGMGESKIDDRETIDADNLIGRLQTWGKKGHGTGKLPLSMDEILKLFWHASDVFLRQPTLLELKPPIKICGNIHGHLHDLMILLELGGYPPTSKYLFLGSYVDYGSKSLEPFCLLLAYKIKYPNNLFVLRGKPETNEYVESNHKFYQEFGRKYNYPVLECLFDCFNCMPMAAIIGGKIFCVHGGLSPELQSLDQIRDFKRPDVIPDTGLFRDLICSNPNSTTNGWLKNNQGEYMFGPDKVIEFLKKHNLNLICRGHQVVDDGYEFFANGQLVTVSSTQDYQTPNQRTGAIMSIDYSAEFSFQIIKTIILGKSNRLQTDPLKVACLVEENKRYQQQPDATVNEISRLVTSVKELELLKQDEISRLQKMIADTRDLVLQLVLPVVHKREKNETR